MAAMMVVYLSPPNNKQTMPSRTNPLPPTHAAIATTVITTHILLTADVFFPEPKLRPLTDKFSVGLKKSSVIASAATATLATHV